MDKSPVADDLFVFDSGPKRLIDCSVEELLQVIRYLERENRTLLAVPLGDWRDRFDPLSPHFGD